MQVLASQLPFLANRNAALAVLAIKIRGHVALLSGPTVYSLYCACTYLGFRDTVQFNYLNGQNLTNKLSQHPHAQLETAVYNGMYQTMVIILDNIFSISIHAVLFCTKFRKSVLLNTLCFQH